jgi:high-affinity iron transporter
MSRLHTLTPTLPLLALLTGLLGASAAIAQAPQSALRQVAGILDYIGGDYRVAVGADGTVLSEPELEEQRTMAREADGLASGAGLGSGDPVRVALAGLAQAIAARRPPTEVAALCRRARELLVTNHAVALEPTEVPSRELGAALYAREGCPSCHGADGSANTQAARALDPQPANFLDAERMLAVSPHRAFYAISFGVGGTAMTAYPKLSEAERWSLAFYVLSLRHARTDAAAGLAALDRAAPSFPPTARGLSGLTDEDLLHALAKLPAAEQHAALGYLRAEAPFTVREGGGLSLTLSRLNEGLAAYRAGQKSDAHRLYIAAYLDGFEPEEPALAARDAELVRAIERAMLQVRQRVSAGAPLPEVERDTRALQALLRQADALERPAGAALIGALTITLREGLEIALLVGALLGLVRKRGAPHLARYVHAGWMLAVPAGLLTFFAAGSLLGGLERELAEGIAALVAAVVLLGVTHWLVGQISSRQFMGFLSKRFGALTQGRGAAGSVLALAFVAAYREAFEIVLFFQALLLDAGDEREQVWLGAALGLALLGLSTLVLKQLGQRLKPRPFMLMSSALLATLAFALTGKGIRALQEAAVVDMSPLSLPELPWLGVYATLEGVLAQGALLMLLTASAVWPMIAAARDRGVAAAE